MKVRPRITRRIGWMAVAALLPGLLIGVAVWARGAEKLQAAQGVQDVPVDAKSISGVVRNGGTPEAGVWVIAETQSLPTLFRRIVVTDDQGRFLVPDLPPGDYEVWVRGYGLRDSARVTAARGQRLALEAVSAASPQEAAQLYPANYWFALYEPPAKEQLPPVFASREEWLGEMKVNCILCHQIGSPATRRLTKPEQWKTAWGGASNPMNRAAHVMGYDILAESLAAWASRIQAGALPAVPPRPAGIERNFVVTSWDYQTGSENIHDEISTDKRDPTLYPYGKVWGIGGQRNLYGLDPKTHEVHKYPLPTGSGGHNPMLDEKGGLWLTASARTRAEHQAGATQDQGGVKGADQPWAPDAVSANIPLTLEDRKRLAGELYVEGANQLVHFDIKTEVFTPIDTIYATHHLQFDARGRLWTSSLQANVLGMFITDEFDPNRPEETVPIAQEAWLDLDPETKEVVTGGGGYGIIVNPVDGTVWRAHPAIIGGSAYSGYQDRPGKPAAAGGITTERDGNKLTKFDPQTAQFTHYPLPPPAIGPKGVDATTDGIIWFGTASGHLGRFDPKTEQFTYWETPGPKLSGVSAKETGSADYHYYLWVDQMNTLGMGKDMVIANGTASDSMVIFNPTTETFTTVRVPYPMVFYSRGLDGRIDDPNAGWKGRGLWANYSNIPVRHQEDGKTYINHIQLRPDPLAP